MANKPDMIQRIATKALIVDDAGRILIIREAKTYTEGTNIGRYHMPGGRLEIGEAFQEGLKREVREETGLAIAIGRPIYVGEWRPVIHGVPNQIIAIFFICSPLSKTIKLSEEHDDFQWIKPDEQKNYDLMSPEDEVIAAYLKTQHE